MNKLDRLVEQYKALNNIIMELGVMPFVTKHNVVFGKGEEPDPREFVSEKMILDMKNYVIRMLEKGEYGNEAFKQPLTFGGDINN